MKVLIGFVTLWAIATAQETRGYTYPCHTVQGFFDVAKQCHPELDGGGDTIDEKLDNLCGSTMTAFSTCVRDKFSSCLLYQDEVDLLLSEYKARFCDDNSLKPEIEALRPSFRCLFESEDACDCNDLCTMEGIEAEMDVCYEKWYNNELFDYTLDPTEMEWARNPLRTLGKATLRCIRNRIELKTGCDANGRDAAVWYNLIYVMAPGPDVVFEDAREWQTFQNRSTVTAFGDPHFKIYYPEATKDKRYSIITCASLGWKTFLNSRYLKIEAFNVPVGLSAADTETAQKEGWLVPSVMASFKLTFLDDYGNAFATYKALAGQYPDKITYANGQTTSEDLKMRISQDGVTLVIQYLSTGVVFTSHAHRLFYLIMSVRMSNVYFNEGSGLMKTGCSKDQQIDAPPGDGEGSINMDDLERRRKRATDSECENACAIAKATSDEIYEACMYDCKATGDAEMAAAANPAEAEKALEDLDKDMYETALAGQYGQNLRLPDSGASVPALSVLTTVIVLLAARALSA